MTTNANDVFKLLGYIQDDLRGVQAKIVSVRAMLSSLNLPEEGPRFTCKQPSCGIGFGSQHRLDEHLENVHGILPTSTTAETGATL